MTVSSQRSLFNGLLEATKPSEVKKILRGIGDSADVTVDEPFGDANLKWQFYGDESSNMSTINLGSHPGRSLIERITNAIDALLEKEMHQREGKPPSSPMEAAKKWFGRPPSTIQTGIHTWDNYQTEDYDRLIHLVMNEGDSDEAPTLDIKDQGIGIRPEDFPETILSLHKGNKIKKKYLAGAFGQGGSATFSFCDYTLIVSRHTDAPEKVGFTVVKLMDLGEEWSENAWVYLTDSEGEILQCEVNEDITLYSSNENDKKDSLEKFEIGTLVRHFGYRIAPHHKSLSPSKNSLYTFLHRMMFDPLLPFRVVDLREGRYKDELVSGSRNRLMKLVGGNPIPEGETGNEVRHYAPREMISPLSGSDPCIGVEYWVVINHRTSGDGSTIRSRSNALFVEPRHPILGTLNGQNQGEITSKPVRDLNLSMVAKHIVIHIDASKASKDVRTGLFSSTRERLKDDIVLDEIIDVLKTRMDQDDRLKQIEKQLIDDLLSDENEETDEEVTKEITSLLLDAGFDVGEVGDVPEPSPDAENGTGGQPDTNGSGPGLEPISTKSYPEVTFFKIAYPDELEVPKDRMRKIRIETDANFRFDRQNDIAIRFNPDILSVAAVSDLQDGHKYWRVKPCKGAEAQESGEVTVTLTKPDGSQLTDVVEFRILPKPASGDKETKGKIPSFKIIKIDPEESEEKFNQIWDDPPSEEVSDLAYRFIETSDQGIIVYFSTAFAPYRKTIEEIKSRRSLSELFVKNYKVWIGYHAILQSQQKADLQSEIPIEEEQLDILQEKERALVAIMQAKQAIRNAETQRQKIAAEAADSD